MSRSTKALRKALAEMEAPRVVTTTTLVRLLAEGGVESGEATVNRTAAALADEGALLKVRRGLFVNRLAIPVAIAEEAAQFLRAGAVIDLQSVLGEAGVLNNPSDVVVASVPVTPGEPIPNVGNLRTDAGRFRFYAVDAKVLLAGERADRLEPVPYPKATPEAAIVHWLHLARSPRSGMRRPPLDSDVDLLKKPRLRRIAKAAGLERNLDAWLSQVADYRADPDVQANASTAMRM